MMKMFRVDCPTDGTTFVVMAENHEDADNKVLKACPDTEREDLETKALEDEVMRVSARIDIS